MKRISIIVSLVAIFAACLASTARAERVPLKQGWATTVTCPDGLHGRVGDHQLRASLEYTVIFGEAWQVYRAKHTRARVLVRVGREGVFHVANHSHNRVVLRGCSA